MTSTMADIMTFAKTRGPAYSAATDAQNNAFPTTDISLVPQEQSFVSTDNNDTASELDVKAIASTVAGGLVAGYGSYKAFDLSPMPSIGIGIAGAALVAYFVFQNKQDGLSCCY